MELERNFGTSLISSDFVSADDKEGLAGILLGGERSIKES